MHLHPAVTLALIFASLATAKTRLNGWYPCAGFAFSDEGSSGGWAAECAMYNSPLCYPGICESPDDVNQNIDVFVKRYPATNGNPKKASNVWFIQGGPGYSSSTLEYYMMNLHSRLNGSVNVYTMDHRGTGRSTRFDCMASQTTTTASTGNSDIDPSEVPACAQDLEFKYGDLSSFSTTSAATDLATFISDYTNGENTTVYGASYGTMLVERLIHLNPPEVIGYVLDGIATASGGPADEFMYMSQSMTATGEVGDRFLDLCKQDQGCRSHFKNANLSATLQNLINKFDKNPNSTCATLINKLLGEENSPSITLRRVFGTLLADTSTRTLIPPVTYRLNRCASKDIDVLSQFVITTRSTLTATNQDDAYISMLLYYTILGLGKYDGNGIIYERDEYWNKSAKIPSQASVLLLSSKLDSQTPNKYAEYLAKALKGDNKELIVFDYATYCTVMTTQLVDGDLSKGTCGMELLMSYVSNGGNLKKLDKSCVDQMPAFNMTVPAETKYSFLSTDDAYDGVYDANLSSPQEGNTSG